MAKYLWLLLICAFGCSVGEAPAMRPSATVAAEAPAPAVAAAGDASSTAKGAASIASGSATSAAGMASERAVIRNASIQLSDEHPTAVTEQATLLARAAGGYVLAGPTQTAAGAVLSSTVVLRVPEPAFEKTIESVRKLASLREESITGEDVTDELVDTEARLRALRKLEARLIGLLEQSAKLTDLLQVEQEVARVNGEIERYEGRLRYLRERTQMATITLTVQAPEQPYVPEHQSIASRFRNAFHSGTEVGLEVIESGIIVLGFVLPASMVAATFGGPVLWLWKRRRRAKLTAASV